MDFDLSEEQRLLKESLDRLIGDRYAFEQRKSYAQNPEGWSREMWAQFAELGLLGLPFEERHGGSAGGPVETMIAFEAFGRALVLEPYLATVVLGGGFLRHGGSAEQCAALVPKIADGSLTFAFAHTERKSRYDLHDIETRVVRDGVGWVLDGEKGVVVHGDTADKLIVTARVGGGRRDRDGVAAFIVDGKATGVSRRGYPTQDGLRAAEITFSGVRVGPEGVLGEPGRALALIERVVDEAIAAHSAEATGAMKMLVDATVEYSKTRKQFGVPIGKFQVLQHRMVDMFVNYEQAISMTLMVTLKLDDGEAERKRAASAAKVQIGKSGRFVGQSAIQVHGGMGMTDELNVGHYFKRLTMIDTLYGNVDHHLRRYAALDRSKAA